MGGVGLSGSKMSKKSNVAMGILNFDSINVDLFFFFLWLNY